MNNMNNKIRELYKRDGFYFIVITCLGTFLGVKTCDYFFYDEAKLLKARE